jgi:signal transduction histidine kinase
VDIGDPEPMRSVPGRLSRLLDLGLWLVVCVPPVTAAVSLHEREVVTAAVGIPLLGVAVALSRRRPLAALAVPVALSLTLDVQMLTPLYWTALVLFGYLAGHRMATSRPALWFFAAVAVVGLPLCALVLHDLWGWPTQLLTLLLTVGLPWLLGRYRRQYAELVGTGWRLADRLEREQQAVADRARIRERARIAGDMHDSLGHDLTLIAVRAGALELDPELDARQQAVVGELREAAGAATERLREIIGVLRADDEQRGQ